MKTSVKYKMFGTFMVLFVMLISILFAFLVAPARTTGNVVYWVFKGICLAWLAAMIVLLWLRKTNFSKFVPPVLMAIVAQIVPSFSRIGFKGETPAVPGMVIIISSLVLFILFSVMMLMLISYDKFKKDEDRAIPSSNSQNS